MSSNGSPPLDFLLFPLPGGAGGNLCLRVCMAPSELFFPTRPSSASLGWAGWCSPVRVALSACKDRAQGRALLLSLGEFLSLQQPPPPTTHSPKEAAVLMALPLHWGLLPLGLCPPRPPPSVGARSAFHVPLYGDIRRGLPVTETSSQEAGKSVVAPVAHRAQCGEGGAGLALGALNQGQVCLSIWL